MPSGTDVRLDTDLLHYSEITCLASFHHTPGADPKGARYRQPRVHLRQGFGQSREPLANLLQVMQHLMSHNGHLKTAIIHRVFDVFPRPLRFCLPGAVESHVARGRFAPVHALARHGVITKNFHVVSFLLPKHLHQDFYNVYAFAAEATILATRPAM